MRNILQIPHSPKSLKKKSTDIHAAAKATYFFRKFLKINQAASATSLDLKEQ
jgi:hypothetical protein